LFSSHLSVSPSIKGYLYYSGEARGLVLLLFYNHLNIEVTIYEK